jgi:hypothetical protein
MYFAAGGPGNIDEIRPGQGELHCISNVNILDCGPFHFLEQKLAVGCRGVRSQILKSLRPRIREHVAVLKDIGIDRTFLVPHLRVQWI